MDMSDQLYAPFALHMGKDFRYQFHKLPRRWYQKFESHCFLGSGISGTLKPFKGINFVGSCSLIKQMCGKNCTYRIRHVDVTSCEDKSRDNISMPSRRRQVQGVASILQQVSSSIVPRGLRPRSLVFSSSSSFSLPQLQEVLRDYMWLYVMSGFRREVTQNYALLVYYATSSDSFLPTFRDNLSVPSSGFKIF
jgi:hypothetical protein